MSGQKFPRYFVRIGGFLTFCKTAILYVRFDVRESVGRCVWSDGLEETSLSLKLAERFVADGDWREITEAEVKALLESKGL